MKRLILITISALVLIPAVYSQNIDDALRYSQVFYTGSARMNAMGSAFTSLGADLSGVIINPAGAGMFRSFEASFTPKLIYNNTTTVWENSRSSDFRYTFGLSQGGIVAPVIKKREGSSLTSLNFGYNYTGTNNFNENTIISGVSRNTSMGDYWTRVSEGIYYKDLRGSAGLAYDAWVIDTITGSGAASYATIFSGYGENTNSAYGQTIKRIINNDGYGGEHSFFIGGNFSETAFFGASIGINQLNYTGHYEHIEADYDNVVPDFKNFVYNDHFEANGTGFSLKAGAAFRIMEIIRLGVAFHSPVIYRISEYFYDSMTSEFDNFDQYEVTNEPLRYSYTLTTPYRILTGASVQIGKLGIISADYELVDYRKAKFSNASDDYNYSNENQDIQSAFRTTSNLRLGAEVRIKPLYLRAGGGFYGSAFTNDEINRDFNHFNVSGGIGFRHQNFYFDLALVHQASDEKYFMYDDPGYLEAADISNRRNTFTATLGLKF